MNYAALSPSIHPRHRAPAAARQRRDPADKSIAVFFSPNGGCTAAIVDALKGARKSVRIQAYLFTSTPIAKAVVEAKERGVKVEAVLDDSNQTDRYSSATYLANHGIAVLIDGKHAIAHNKIIIIDDATIITGSFNFSKAAEERNAENLLIISGHAELAAQYVRNFEAHRAHSTPYKPPAATEGAAEERKPTASADASTAKFVGSKNSDVSHYPGCSVVKQIKAENLVRYDSAPAGKRLHKGCPQ